MGGHLTLPLRCRGACLVCRPPTLPPLYPAGGVLSLSPACPAFSLLPCPPSPSPFPDGEGGDQGYFMQGASPLASPAFNRLRHLQTFSNMNPAEGLPGWSPANLTAAVPAGGLAFLVACLPCHLLSFCPLSPRPPSPVGKGETISLFRRGLRPRHPCIRPFATLTVSAMRAPRARSLRCGAKPKEPPFL